MQDNIVTNTHGVEIDFNVAVNLMNDDIREEVYFKCTPCSSQIFFNRYCEYHEERLSEVWELAKANPQY